MLKSTGPGGHKIANYGYQLSQHLLVPNIYKQKKKKMKKEFLQKMKKEFLQKMKK